MPKRSKQPLHGDRRFYVELALAFANNTFASVQEAQSLFWNALGFEFDVVGLQDDLLRDIRRERLKVRARLAEIVKDPVLTEQQQKSLNRSLRQVTCRPQLDEAGRIAMEYQAADIVHAAHLGTACLYDTGLAVRLRACENENCGKFLLAEGQATRTKFCQDCAADNEKRNTRKRRQRNYRRNWLKDNDPDMYAAVEAEQMTVEDAFEHSKQRLKRK